MKNITLAIPDDLLVASREYARRHRTTLNQMVRQLLARETLRVETEDNEDLLECCDRLSQLAKSSPDHRRWKREDAYEGRI